MLTDHQLKNLPHDPQAAFVEFYRMLKIEISDQLSQIQDNENNVPIYQEFCNEVYGFFSAVQPPGLKLPAVDHSTPWEQEYSILDNTLSQYNFMSRIRLNWSGANSNNEDADVKLSAETQEQIHKHIGRIRNIVAVATLTNWKRNAIFRELNNLAAEVDRTKTRMEAIGGLLVYFSSVTGESAKRLEPAVKLAERIQGLFVASVNEQEMLEAPEEVKLLESPTTSGDDVLDE